ncbi:hypothetical protein OG874_14980 [Nocardia sp. NBC_00565]|uniref:hypothetical protein n=1 Tax=Nocardia sp. NBC_00565 TaxID=2975993 RepID=UPI002E7FF837|nr:hypothetical protein [Nocardia sp. NBC_00565]WUC06355.1 hypothetical protein OG874_14980 [Nocardia sp. NBC_00565]
MTEVDQSVLGVVIEDDATPFVRAVARAIRSALRQGTQIPAGPPKGERTVVISAKGDPQTATCVLADGRIEISHGAAIAATATAMVDVYDLAVDVEASTGDEQLINDIAALVNPTSSMDWKTAAHEFWSRTAESPGMPHELILESIATNERLVLGSGLPTYRLVATEDDLSRLCTGTVGLLEALGAGAVAIQGTLPQLSVMTGAFNKMRFDV